MLGFGFVGSALLFNGARNISIPSAVVEEPRDYGIWTSGYLLMMLRMMRYPAKGKIYARSGTGISGLRILVLLRASVLLICLLVGVVGVGWAVSSEVQSSKSFQADRWNLISLGLGLEQWTVGRRLKCRLLTSNLLGPFSSCTRLVFLFGSVNIENRHDARSFTVIRRLRLPGVD